VRTTIDQHISDLLYSHECVVVPGFGAFLTRYYPAEINTATNMLRPPSKRVAFNQRINENDGLLAKQVAKVEGVSYEEALESILISVRSWQRILSSGKKINLYGVGRLFYDDQGLMQVSPALDINYNIHSYGLNIFRATAMEREQQIKRSVNRAIENNSKTTTAKRSSTNKNPKPSTAWVKWAAILGPVVALVLYGYFNPEKVESAAGYVTNVFSSNSSETNQEEEAPAEDSELEAADNTSTNSGERNGLYNLKNDPNIGPTINKIRFQQISEK
jgi:nucleoid DNA-binding protein